MPALRPAAGVARVVVSGKIEGVACNNVFHTANQATPLANWSPADLASLAGAVRSCYDSFIRPLLTNAYVLGDVTAVDLSSSTGAAATVSGSGPGTGASPSAPANAALCVSWRVAMHYRGGHGRSYFSGLPSTAIFNANSWLGATQTAWTTAAGFIKNSLTATYGAATCQMIMLRRYSDGAELATPLQVPITGVSVDSRIDSQRRRLGRDR
jgi:hypothetical protein